MPNIFKRARRQREQGAGLGNDTLAPKGMPPGNSQEPTQADFLYGKAADLKKKK